MTATAVARRLYADEILEQIPRTLGLMDRERESPTAGCMDRTYWAWKFVDFPGARFQEGVCVLSYAYTADLGDARLRGNPRLLEWIGLGLEAWARMQYRDGSFDEAYPFERSLAATAFTSFYVSEALLMAGDSLPPDVVAHTREALGRAGDWLCRNDESHGFLSNHLAAAAAALEHIGRITGEPSHAQRSRHFLDRILSHQSAEGWYEEYGGADPGYQTHGSFYLARIWQLTGDDDLLASLKRSTRFLAHFVHPDRSLGGEYASRNTQTYYPAAFEMLAPVDDAAAFIADHMRSAVRSVSAAGLRGIDAYNFFPLLNNLVFADRALVASDERAHTADPTPERGMSWFPAAGLARVRTAAYDAFIGVAKGGVVKMFDRETGRLALSDCGYVGRLAGGRLITSQYQDDGRPMEVRADAIEVESRFQTVSRPTMRPWRFLAFRAFLLTLGRVPAAAQWLKRKLVRVLVYRRSAVPLELRRVVRFEDARVTIEDTLRSTGTLQAERLAPSDRFATIHMGSSRYFVFHELGAADAPAEPVPLHELGRGVTRSRSVDVN